LNAEIHQLEAERLIVLCSDLYKNGTKIIHLLLSTPGGDVSPGINLYYRLKAMPLEFITHNVGEINSMGNVLFQVGKKRYACKNTTFMFHGVGITVQSASRLERKALTEYIETIDRENNRIGSIITDCTKITNDEMNAMFMAAKVVSSTDAIALGIIDEVRDITIPIGATVYNFSTIK
jgi:ATP-dependent protease ClpP protease subunit